MDDASLRGLIFSHHGHAHSGNSVEVPFWSNLDFYCASCPTSTSSWAWGTQRTLSSEDFLQSGAGWLVFSVGETSQPLLRAARRNSAAFLFRLDLTRGGRQRLTGRPRLSSIHIFEFLHNVRNISFALTRKRSRTPQCGGGERLLRVDFQVSILILARSLAAL